MTEISRFQEARFAAQRKSNSVLCAAIRRELEGSQLTYMHALVSVLVDRMEDGTAKLPETVGRLVLLAGQYADSGKYSDAADLLTSAAQTMVGEAVFHDLMNEGWYE